MLGRGVRGGEGGGLGGVRPWEETVAGHGWRWVAEAGVWAIAALAGGGG